MFLCRFGWGGERQCQRKLVGRTDVKSKTNNGLNRIAQLNCFDGIGSREHRRRNTFVQGEVLSWNAVCHEIQLSK